MKKLYFCLFFVIFLFTNQVDATAPLEVNNAANKGLITFKKVASKEYKSYGYHNLEELQDAEILYGMELYSIDYSKLLEQREDTWEKVIIPTGNWEFLIGRDRQVISKMSVVKENSSYTAVSFGGDGTIFNDMMDQLEKGKIGREGKLVVHNGHYYYVVENNSEEIVMPVQLEHGLMSMSNKQNILESIRNEVEHYAPGDRSGVKSMKEETKSFPSSFVLSLLLATFLWKFIGSLRSNPLHD